MEQRYLSVYYSVIVSKVSHMMLEGLGFGLYGSPEQSLESAGGAKFGLL